MPWFFDPVSSGKKLNVRNKYQPCKPDKVLSQPGRRKLHRIAFMIAASVVITLFLGLHSYMSSFVYVVMLNNQEVGIVHNAREIESFVIELTDRSGELYGMNLKVREDIEILKQFRPDTKATPENVRDILRRRITFVTDAFMISVNGEPLIPVAAAEELDTVRSLLKEFYQRNESGAKLIDAVVVDDLSVKLSTVSPADVWKPEEVAALLVAENSGQPLFVRQLSTVFNQGSYDGQNLLALDGAFEDSANVGVSTQAVAVNNIVQDDLNVTVITVEEFIIIEPIPYDVEYVNNDKMTPEQQEIITPGQEGSKEIVFHITRENGVEIDRVKVEETILQDPVTQVIERRMARTTERSVPQAGEGDTTNVIIPAATGQFMWPVEGVGRITPGRGFSSWHTGIDIPAPSGTNIFAADNGVVWFSGFGRSQGNYLIIHHGSYWTLYLHNSANLVSEGDQVAKGEVIARVGSTGRSTGPHLHFEVRRDDGTQEWRGYFQHRPIDPLQFFAGVRVGNIRVGSNRPSVVSPQMPTAPITDNSAGAWPEQHQSTVDILGELRRFNESFSQ